MTVTRKPLDKLQNAFFGKISRSEWVKKGLGKYVEKIPGNINIEELDQPFEHSLYFTKSAVYQLNN